MSSKGYIVQISDCHLFGDKNTRINGANAYANLNSVLTNIKHLSLKPDLIVVSGDLSQDCTFESYQHLANLLNKVGIKYYLLPGNHDDINVMNKVFELNWIKENIDYFFELNNWLVYIIDTSAYPDDSGTLSKNQLLKLQTTLTQNKINPTIIFMHHHPVKINSLWMDKMILKESQKFNDIIGENSQVKAVLFGHIHQVFERIINNTFYASAPSTSYQVLPNTEMFTVEKPIPGYRSINLEENKLSSKIVWVE